MKYEADSPEAYIDLLPEDRQEPIRRLRKCILSNLPEGFEETMSYGMIGYVVPHSKYPAGYHCNPELPLPFLNIASQKNFIAFYHSGIYADPELKAWFVEAYRERVPTKLDMGKSCIRFKKPEHIPYELLGALCRKISVSDWIQLYEEKISR
ncbi:DUF1801 domain-containing protein [Robiginitalea aurantiaca]|uniref:DUF1801 domain-containing protein n=1 Tax=Robiginitalea aurantiaca TaxID=3056915 RepID=A0ABT7WBB9_9FLAO|nr:DUF1801 domain-containing protein [Robiginitalea aurantiaca]MDM9630202.1 DUF1801 domain-containing protein [Robiginitalea aurantiaca]